MYNSMKRANEYIYRELHLFAVINQPSTLNCPVSNSLILTIRKHILCKRYYAPEYYYPV